MVVVKEAAEVEEASNVSGGADGGRFRGSRGIRIKKWRALELGIQVSVVEVMVVMKEAGNISETADSERL